MQTPYNQDFFDQQADESSQAAEIVIPLVWEMLNPESVLDVGCGIGTWLQVWMKLGVIDVMGVDGPYVPRDQLLVPGDHYTETDLAQPLDLSRRFDLVSCLEVGEHLDHADAATLVSSVARHGDVVLFAAATPGQDGTHHVNCAWPSYWAGLFADNGLEVLDALRPRLWNDDRIVWWYRQNMLLFVTPRGREMLNAQEMPRSIPLDIVHPGLVGDLTRERGVREQTRDWGRVFVRSLARRLHR